MRTIDPCQLIELFLDDELPVELASEFKQAMFEDPGLREEVAERRAAREALAEHCADDGPTRAEFERIRGRVNAFAGAVSVGRVSTQLELPLNREQLHLTLISE